MASDTQVRENVSVITHLRRAADHIAAQVRRDNDTRSSNRIAAEALGVAYSTWLQYTGGRYDVPYRVAQQIEEEYGYPKRHLRPDIWEK